jgi:hypothetical protein
MTWFDEAKTKRCTRDGLELPEKTVPTCAPKPAPRRALAMRMRREGKTKKPDLFRDRAFSF